MWRLVHSANTSKVDDIEWLCFIRAKQMLIGSVELSDQIQGNDERRHRAEEFTRQINLARELFMNAPEMWP